ncbi:helix-turn-helix transcriptional regulator [Spirillospora sp. NPDC029432]|uniref:PadR family transcriptional regulator n=1 Tax=Spirillospora sp. NPDC029432 TaxID=3154599 RepID=UPI0034530CF2
MIRAGREAVTSDDVASAHGFVSLRAAKRAGLFDVSTLPPPINRRGGKGRGNKALYDALQVYAHAAGEQVPELPTADHPDDLLDLREAADAWGISPVTWQYYLNTRPHLVPGPVEVGGVLHWRRGDLEAFDRPGRGTGAGRPAGMRDAQPRRRRGQIQAQVLLVLAEGPRNGNQLAEEIAHRSAGPKPTSLHATLAKLREAGLLDSDAQGRTRIYCLTDAGQTRALELRGASAEQRDP